MNFQELQQEKLENTQYEYADNVKLVVVFQDPITNKMIHLPGSSNMNISMDEYAALRVPEGVPYNIVTFENAPDHVLPELNPNSYSDRSLNMFYRYLNAL